MRGSRAKAIRREVAAMGLDDSERKYAERQAKSGRRYVVGFDPDTYQQVYFDRLTGERNLGVMPYHLGAVRL